MTLYDFNMGICLMLLSPRSMARMRTVVPLVALCAVPVVVLLYLTAHVMWLENGVGEANFLYFQCLAYNIFTAILTIGFCGACIRREKALRLMEKELLWETIVASLKVPSDVDSKQKVS
jgi:GPI-anchor transamidase subunit U